MIRISSQELKTLSTVLERVYDFIVVGEMHGSRQNAPLIQELLSVVLAEPKPVTIAFEWALTGSERDALQIYIHGGEIPTPLPTFFLNSDGRFTYEHISLLKWIRTHNSTYDSLINLHTFDESIGSEEPEYIMADSLRAYKKNHPESIILVETGNMHARNSPYVFKGMTNVPMAMILKRDYTVFSIFLQYLQGKISIEGENRDVTKATSQQEGPGAYFDAVIEVPVSEAAPNPETLTRIAQML